MKDKYKERIQDKDWYTKEQGVRQKGKRLVASMSRDKKRWPLQHDSQLNQRYLLSKLQHVALLFDYMLRIILVEKAYAHFANNRLQWTLPTMITLYTGQAFLRFVLRGSFMLEENMIQCCSGSFNECHEYLPQPADWTFIHVS